MLIGPKTCWREAKIIIMCWGTAPSAAHAVLLNTNTPRRSSSSPSTCLSTQERPRSMLSPGGCMYAQCEQGVCQIGSSWTTWLDNLPRRFDAHMKGGVHYGGKLVRCQPEPYTYLRWARRWLSVVRSWLKNWWNLHCRVGKLSRSIGFRTHSWSPKKMQR